MRLKKLLGLLLAAVLALSALPTLGALAEMETGESISFVPTLSSAALPNAALDESSEARARLAALLLADASASWGQELYDLTQQPMRLGIVTIDGEYEAYFLSGATSARVVLISLIPASDTAYFSVYERSSQIEMEIGAFMTSCERSYELAPASSQSALEAVLRENGLYGGQQPSYDPWEADHSAPAAEPHVYSGSLSLGGDVRFYALGTEQYPLSYIFHASAQTRALLTVSLLCDLALSQDIDLFEMLDNQIFFAHDVVYDADVYTIIGTAQGCRVAITYVPVTGYCVYNAQYSYLGSAADYARSQHPNYSLLGVTELDVARYSRISELIGQGLLDANTTLGQARLPVPTVTPTPAPSVTSAPQQGYLGRVMVQGGTNVRKKTYNDSELVTYISQDGIYEYYELKNGWYYILLPDGRYGYVYRSRCTEVR
ncbi:MAG: hypothetical protein II697_05605 [Clostridia bacterium]|nr:hypothetical protein [Clostridia bacterium]